jgi:hypothetical protein
MEPIRGKRKNHRLYPGARCKRPDNHQDQVNEAKERQAAWDGLSIQQKLDSLDTRLGKGVGAVKQRARLVVALTARQTKKEAIAATIEQNQKDGVYEALEHQTSQTDVWENSKKENNKKYMKGAKQ